MQFNLLSSAILLSIISSVVAAPFLDSNLNKRAGILDDTSGDLTGDDLAAWNACVAVTASEAGESCGSLTAGTGAQDGCYAAEISIQKPCENAAVQARLTVIYCTTAPIPTGIAAKNC